MAELDKSNVEIFGRKVFFLYPHAVIKNDLIPTLCNAEYEVAVLREPDQALHVLKQFPYSMLFVNVDTFMSETDWVLFLSKFPQDHELSTCVIGVCTTQTQEQTLKIYKEKFRAATSIIAVSSDPHRNAAKFLPLLEKYGCHGRRKYVRVNCDSDSMAKVNFDVFSQKVQMKLHDISTVGFSAFLSTPIEATSFSPKTKISNAQVSLRGALIMTDLIFYAVQNTQTPATYVFLFASKLDMLNLSKIRKYVRNNIQSKIDSIM